MQDACKYIIANPLIANVSEFEGTLDLLLTMSRFQIVDLYQISISDLAEKYLTFASKAEALRLELNADYLSMAALLALLKSRLLLPLVPIHKEPSGTEFDLSIGAA